MMTPSQSDAVEVVVNYRELLEKYIAYVRDCEGSDYIGNGYRGYRGNRMFTPEEWAELERVARSMKEPRNSTGGRGFRE
jgi:hypothetical protein